MKFTFKSFCCSALGLAGVWLFLVLAFGCSKPAPKVQAPEPKRVGRACVYVLDNGTFEFAPPPCDYDEPKAVTHGPKSPAVTGNGNSVNYQ